MGDEHQAIRAIHAGGATGAGSLRQARDQRVAALGSHLTLVVSALELSAHRQKLGRHPRPNIGELSGRGGVFRGHGPLVLVVGDFDHVGQQRLALGVIGRWSGRRALVWVRRLFCSGVAIGHVSGLVTSWCGRRGRG